MYERIETPLEAEERKNKELEHRKWRNRLDAFVAAHSASLWGAGGKQADGRDAVHGIGVRVTDDEHCVVLYTAKRTGAFNESLGRLRKVAKAEDDNFRFDIDIIAVEEPRPQAWRPPK